MHYFIFLVMEAEDLVRVPLLTGSRTRVLTTTFPCGLPLRGKTAFLGDNCLECRPAASGLKKPEPLVALGAQT